MALSYGDGLTILENDMQFCNDHITNPVKDEDNGKGRPFTISTNCYYGFQSINIEPDRACEDGMEITESNCQMTPFHSHQNQTVESQTPCSGKKRNCDEVINRHHKRFRTGETTAMQQPAYYLRATHNNPDISRCLMAHMI